MDNDTSSIPDSIQDHYIVCGMGHVGYRIVLLLRRLGLQTVVIYDNASDEWLQDARDAGVFCLQGDAQNEHLLIKAQIGKARGIVAATDKDMVNLSVALDGMRLNPCIIMIVRLYDQELARYLQGSLKTRQVLSTSVLSSPVFVAAALGEDTLGTFHFSDRQYAVVSKTNNALNSAATLVPLLKVANDQVEEISDFSNGVPPEEVLVVRSTIRDRAGSHHKHWTGWAHLGFMAVNVVRRIAWGPLFLVATLLTVVLSGIFAVHFSMHLNYLDAFYFVVTTITTTGYGDVSFLNAPPLMKVFGCFLMMSGAALLALLFGIITDAVISRRFQEFLKGGRIQKQDHIIVVGSGHIALRIIEELTQQGREPVVICRTAAETSPFKGLHIPIIEGDARMERVLQLAAVNSAAAIISVHEEDVINLGVALHAKKLNPAIRTVARVFDGVLAEKLQRQLAVDCVMSVSAVSAPSFVAACLHEHVVRALVWKEHLLAIRERHNDDVSQPTCDFIINMSQDTATGALTRIEQTGSEKAPILQVCIHKLGV